MAKKYKLINNNPSSINEDKYSITIDQDINNDNIYYVIINDIKHLVCTKYSLYEAFKKTKENWNVKVKICFKNKMACKAEHFF